MDAIYCILHLCNQFVYLAPVHSVRAKYTRESAGTVPNTTTSVAAAVRYQFYRGVHEEQTPTLFQALTRPLPCRVPILDLSSILALPAVEPEQPSNTLSLSLMIDQQSRTMQRVLKQYLIKV